MQLKSRLNKLEKRHLPPQGPSIILHRIIGAENGKPSGEEWLGPAHIIGTPFTRVMPYEGESEDTFLRRLYAIRAGGKMVEDMSEEEQAMAFAAADIELEKANADAS